MNNKEYYMEDVSNLYEKENLCKIILGHLAIENKIEALLKKQFTKYDYLKKENFRFSQKISLLLSFSLIDEKLGCFIKKLNTYRNKMAHRAEFEVCFDDAFELVNQAHVAGVDFSDDGIWSNKTYSKENYDIEGIIIEILINTNTYLGFKLEESGYNVFW